MSGGSDFLLECVGIALVMAASPFAVGAWIMYRFNKVLTEDFVRDALDESRKKKSTVSE